MAWPAPYEGFLTIGLNRAVSLLAEPRPQRRGAPTPIKTLGNHPDDGQPVNLFSGRYGPYVKHGDINATVPSDIAPEEITLQQAIDLIAARPQSGKGRRGKSRAASNAAAATEAAVNTNTKKKGTAPRGQKTQGKASPKKKAVSRKTAAAAE